MKSIALIGLISIITFIINMIWELAQAPLFKGFAGFRQHFKGCLIASFGDVAITLLIFFAFAFVYKSLFWIKTFSVQSVVALVLIGFFTGIAIEWWALENNRWSYGNQMPLVPFTNIALLPVLQFTLLPLVIFYVVNFILKKKSNG